MTSIALRLNKRVVIDPKTGDSVGLGGLDCAKCSPRSKVQRGCRLPGYHFTRTTPLAVDYHKPRRPHLDLVLFCPASIPGIYEAQADAYELVSIRDSGGLREHFDCPTAALPKALLETYKTVTAASERIAAEVADAFAGKRST